MPEITMPKLSDTMTEGTVVAWKKKKGDQVTTGEVIAEIETDKATMEWESPEDGVLTEIYVEEGGKVEIGQKIALIGEAGEKPKEKPEAPKQKTESEKPAPAKKQEKETAPPEESVEETQRAKPKKAASQPPRPATAATGDAEPRVKASPVARRLA